MRSARFGVLVVLMLSVARAADGQVPTLRGLAFEESLDEPVVLAPAIPDGGLREHLPLVARLKIDLAAFEGPNGATTLDRLGARLQLYKARKVPVVLVLGAVPVANTDVQGWQRRLRIVAERHRGAVAGYEFGRVALPSASVVQPEPGTVPRPPEAAGYAFLVKQTSVLLRSIDPDTLIALGPLATGASTWLSDVYAQGVAPYVEAVAILNDGDLLGAGVVQFGALLDRHDPTAALWANPAFGGGANGIIAAVLRHLGTRVALTMFREPRPAVQGAVTAASRLADVLSGSLVTLDAATLRWLKNGTQVASMPGKLLYGTTSGGTYLVFEAAEAGPIEVETDVSMTAPALRDPYTGAIDRLALPARERGRPSRLSLTVPPKPQLPQLPLLLDFNYGQASIALTSEARQASLPPVEEIIARHQARQTAQDAALRNYVGHLRIEMHFHLAPADPAYNVITENRVFAEGAATEWVEESFSLNGATWKENRPGFPLLQPEKVLSLPLDLRLNQDYRYRLAGVDTVGGREAYVVRFTPVATTQTLYRGTVWVDRASFARLKVSAVQIGGSGVVQANEEEQLFTTVGDAAGQPIWLLTHLTNRQTLLVAGRTILNEREVHLTDVRMNLADFDSVRAAARTGDRIMYRDTAAGVRYLVKRGAERVVSETMSTSARAFAMGANIDPSFDYPLPIAGLDILDFDFLGKDLQLALLFGGVIGFGNIQKAGLLDGKVDASVDFFGIAIKGNDAVFDDAGERTGERLQTLPSSVGLNVGYRLNSAHKLSGRAELSYHHYSRAALTAAAFMSPSSTVTTGQGVGYEFRRRGYSVLLNASAYRRKTWAPWGFAGAGPALSAAEGRTYTRYDAGLSKDFIFNTFHTIHVNGQYFGGRRLDRFSMYQFGMFDAARMHGVPTAVRFAELVMLRGSYSFNLFEQYRFDLFLDHAIGRRASAGDWQRVTGMGAAVSLRGPRNTILRADVGRSILPNVYKGAGSTVVQILILKPL